jgi:hypothetical protein
MSTVRWLELSREERLLLNPAFLAAILARLCGGYAEEGRDQLALPLAIVGASMTLHRATRETLPASVATNLIAWIEDHQDIAAVIPLRASRLTGVVLDGGISALASGSIAISETGNLQLTGRIPSYWGEGEVREVQARARFLGRWFSRSGSPPSVLAVLGVRP